MDRGRRVQDARHAATRPRYRHVLQHAALRRRQSAGAATTSPTATRNAGTVYAFDTFTFTPALTVDLRRPVRAVRLSGSAQPAQPARGAVARCSSAAPGSRWPCPAAPTHRAPRSSCRRASTACGCRRSARSRPMERGAPLRAERTTQVEAGIERDFGPTTLAVRGFRQHVDDQMVTVFGADAPDFPGSRERPLRRRHRRRRRCAPVAASRSGPHVGSRVRGSVDLLARASPR